MSFLPISVLMRNGTHKWIQLKRCCRYPYGSFFKLMFTMWTSKLSLCLLIFGLHHDLNNKEYKIIPPKLFFFTCRILKTLPCLRNAILSARVPSCRLHPHPSQFAPSRQVDGPDFHWLRGYAVVGQFSLRNTYFSTALKFHSSETNAQCPIRVPLSPSCSH